MADRADKSAAAHGDQSAARCPYTLLFIIILVFAGLIQPALTCAQAGGHKLFGDLRIDETKAASESLPLSYDIILYGLAGNVLQRVSIPNRGRYQFLGLADGQYDVVVEVENRLITRIRVSVFSPFKTDFRQDIELAWRSAGAQTIKAATVSAADFYQRSAANSKLFLRAQQAANERKYERAILALRELLKNDAQDFQAWTELGTAYFAQQSFDLAERSYLSAIQTRPGFLLANINLGRLYLMQKRFANAIDVLQHAVAINSHSADANYFLGESYLQAKRGSAAVQYLNEALALDPQGMAEVHLRLALLYHGAGLKEKAALEYQAFLAKRPAYPDRKRLEKYIAENKKR